MAPEVSGRGWLVGSQSTVAFLSPPLSMYPKVKPLVGETKVDDRAGKSVGSAGEAGADAVGVEVAVGVGLNEPPRPDVPPTLDLRERVFG